MRKRESERERYNGGGEREKEAERGKEEDAKQRWLHEGCVRDGSTRHTKGVGNRSKAGVEFRGEGHIDFDFRSARMCLRVRLCPFIRMERWSLFREYYTLDHSNFWVSNTFLYWLDNDPYKWCWNMWHYFQGRENVSHFFSRLILHIQKMKTNQTHACRITVFSYFLTVCCFFLKRLKKNARRTATNLFSSAVIAPIFLFLLLASDIRYF